uniref:Putative ribonuclease H-like domain-containing protein n=1 Tax=Tanacetum cinerariifolium TaxID=118510 RepID=A0A6L2P0U8_TANCI|nr:putative ribonuclease H-like domain-containing protein [Tanacetum cinerariifolium]
MPPRADLSFARLDNSVFKSKVSETIASVPKIETNASKTSKDSLEKPKTVRSSTPIIEDWESDSEDENVFEPKEVKKIVKPSLEKIEFYNARNTTVENENKAKKPRKFSQSPRGNKRKWNGLMTQKLGDSFEFKKKTSFVCRSINHLIKDCDFYENKMVMNNKGKITGPNEIRPVCDNTARVNHQNKLTHPHPKRNFVPAAVLIKSGQVPVNAAKQSSHRAVLSVSAARHVNTVASRPSVNNATYSYFKAHSPDQGIFDSGCSRHMTGNKFYLLDYKEIDGGFELKFNLFSVSQMCDKKNSVLFTNTECVVLSLNFKLIDESQVLLKVPRNNMYSFDLKNVVPVGGLTCLFANATLDESILCHKRLGHINFKTMNKLVSENLVRGLPSKLIKNDHTCVACQKGKQHKASSCIENQMDHKVKTIRSDNETEFKNRIMKEFCEMKGYSINSKAFRVFNTRTRYVEENLHINFLENKPNVAGTGPNWMFDIHTLTMSMNYQPVFARNQTNGNACNKANIDAGQASVEADFNNLELTTVVSPIPTIRISKNHPNEQIIGNPLSALQTRRMTKTTQEQATVWRIVDLPKGKHAIRTKWFYKNKKDDRGIVVRNKARLVAQGYTQEEGIDYDEIFAPVARIEVIRLILAYASFIRFIMYQMDVKSAFLYGTIEKELYVCQPSGFEDLYFPNKVYKVKKALYGLHQAPRVWYETLSTYLLENGFRRGIIDKTVFIKKDKGDILLVQVYVDDIKKYLCTKFEGLIHKNFQMNSIGELTFFLGLQVLQKDDGIFISQDKKRLISWQCKKQIVVANSTTKAEYVAAANYCGQATAKSKKVNDVEQIHVTVDGKTVVMIESSVRSDLHFNNKDVPQVVKGEGSGQPFEPQQPSSTALPSHEEQVTTVASQPQKTHTPRQAKRGRDSTIPQSSGPPKKVGDEAIYIGEDDRVGTGLGSGSRCQDTNLGDADAQTSETASKQFHDPPLSKVNTSGNEGDSMVHHDDLTYFVPSRPHDSPISGGHTPGSDEGDFDDIDDMVDKAMDNVKGDIVNATIGVSATSALVTIVGVSISNVEPRTPLTTTTKAFEDEDLTIAQTLLKMRSEKAKEKGVVFSNVEESARPTKILSTIDPKDKGKGIMQEPKKPLKNSRKARIQMDEELALRLHKEEKAKLERMQRDRSAQKEASNVALTAKFDDVQARMDADALLAAKLQEEEREHFTYNQLKNKSLEEIQKLYERKQNWINDFVPMDSEVIKDSRNKDDSSQKQAESTKKRPRAKHDEENDVLDLYRLVKQRYKTISPEGYDILLWGDLITLFEPSKEDEIWKAQQDYNLISWRLFDSCGVHVLLMDSRIAIYMIVERKYPLIQEMLSRMLNRRLEIDHESEMAFELIRFIKAQLEE